MQTTISTATDEVTVDDDHYYWRRGRRVIGVTETLSLVLRDYESVPPDVLVRARDIGIAGARACELDDLGQLDAFDIPAAITPYLEAWQAFKRETGFQPIAVEHLLYSLRYNFAGRLDVLGLFPGDRLCTLIDRKIVRQVQRATRLQTAGYKQAATETFPDLVIGDRMAVQLLPNGRPKIDGPYRDPMDWHVFAAALTVARWKEAAS